MTLQVLSDYIFTTHPPLSLSTLSKVKMKGET